MAETHLSEASVDTRSYLLQSLDAEQKGRHVVPKIVKINIVPGIRYSSAKASQLLVFIVCWVFLGAPVTAQEGPNIFSGRDLVDLCAKQPQHSTECLYFFQGWSEGSEAIVQHAAGLIFAQQQKVPSYEEWMTMTSILRGYCIPEAVTLDQAIAVVLDYLSDNPQFWHEAAGQSVTSAITSAFPCQLP